MSYPNKITLTINAKEDIKSILRYTLDTWGKTQKNTYKKLIDKSLNAIANMPYIGRYKSDYNAYLHNMGKHIIAYEIHKSNILIVRILHNRMNIQQQLHYER